MSNNESLSGMKGNESLTDTNNSLILGISPIRPLASPTQKDVPAEKRGKLHSTSGYISDFNVYTGSCGSNREDDLGG